ncbi:MAG: hypothetical protein EON58_06150 [Alphaproteobacteria bacterium]|nr:MAG: hypothetical protein EON58_06150 [Alphaproteobacteria bacterium]
MNRWWLLGVILFGCIFALFGFLRISLDVMDARSLRVILGLFLFGCYYGIVAFGTSEKTRSLSVLAQTLLGIALALAIASLASASIQGYVLAVALGLVLGFTADFWLEYVRWP